MPRVAGCQQATLDGNSRVWEGQVSGHVSTCHATVAQWHITCKYPSPPSGWMLPFNAFEFLEKTPLWLGVATGMYPANASEMLQHRSDHLPALKSGLPVE